MTITLKEIGSRLQAFFNESVETVAHKTKFVERTSKLTGNKFLQALVFNSLEKPEMTLASMSQSLLDLGVTISPQGIDERIDESSVSFLCELFSQAGRRFALNEPLTIKLLAQFSGVYLIDSTQISLPPTMANLFPGSGGNASSASLKIQLVFDYLYGHLEQVELKNGCEPDQGYRGHWRIIHKDALLIMDLGYFALDTFKQISDQQGYFLSRLQSQTGLLTPNGEPLELTNLLASQTQNLAEVAVLLGNRQQHQIPCRLIMIRLPQEAAERQRQRAKENARRHGRTVTQAYLKLLDWALFVTNVPDTMLHTQHVAALYHIRWQIELVFKLSKSFCGLAHVAALRPQRILTELYARLIGLVLTYFLIAPVRLPAGSLANHEISPTKVRLIFQRFARSLALTLAHSDSFLANLHELFRHINHSGFKHKRKKSPNSIHALALISACYGWPDEHTAHDAFADLLSLDPFA